MSGAHQRNERRNEGEDGNSSANANSDKRKAKQMKIMTRKSDKNITPSIIEIESNSSRTRRRVVKQKYPNNEWLTDSPHNERKKREKMQIKEESNTQSEPETEVEIELQEGNGFERSNDSESQSFDEEFENSDSPLNIQSYSLAHWKRGIKCPLCIYIGHSATRLEQHYARVHGEDITYKCKMCSFVCKWNREYYKHMKSHFEGPPYKCEDCEYTCDRIQFIISHRMRHTDERPYECELCEFKSRTKGNLVVHMRVHTGEKPFKCQQCDRSFAMKNTLEQHMATHREDRPFLCDSCGFTTKYQSHLLSHKRIHTGNVFHCYVEGCNYFTPRRTQLAAHMRSHLSIRSHICATCGKAFIEKSHLIRHERIHLDEKPFKCEHCDYGSSRRDKLKEHILKHHSSDGKAKPPYKPRKSRRQSSQQTDYFVEHSDDNSMNDNSQSQMAIVSSSHEIQPQMSEQEISNATASLIYEYSSGDMTVTPTRVVIQPSVSYNNEINASLIERILEHTRNNPSARVVIQSIPSTSYVDNQSVEQKESDEQNAVNERHVNDNNNENIGGLSAFMALF